MVFSSKVYHRSEEMVCGVCGPRERGGHDFMDIGMCGCDESMLICMDSKKAFQCFGIEVLQEITFQGICACKSQEVSVNH